MRLWSNAIGYQATWIAAVAGAGWGWWWLGPATCLLFIAWHFRATPWPAADLRLLGLAVVLGLVVDTLWLQGGLLRFAAAVPSPEWAPLWILALWAAFALTLNHCLSGLQGRPFLAGALGLVGAPLAYWIAARSWAAAEMLAPTWAVLASIGLAWALLTPLLLGVAARWRDERPA